MIAMVTVSAAVTVLVLTLSNTTDGRSELEANLELLPLTTLEEVASSADRTTLSFTPDYFTTKRNSICMALECTQLKQGKLNGLR